MSNTTENRQQMNIVIIGHVDHGKSTVIGRLLADTGSLPKGKLDDVKAICAKNARPFEYAFLLDALKDEQAQGITIDSARCFFRSDKREYIIIDAPGHIEFLKNMISGAARAEAALLVIDAKEGVRENSRRHGYLLSMLGVKQVAICVNKMDLVDYSRDVFDAITAEYTDFLKQIDTEAMAFIPVSAREGDNVATRSEIMSWYDGPVVLDMLDRFEKEPSPVDKPLRFPVQDIYKFTDHDDDRRIVAGRVDTGTVKVGDEVIFLPSEKRSAIASVEAFNLPVQESARAGQSTGVTLTEQIYIKPGELMCKINQRTARVTSQIKVNIFWMAHQPMIKNKRYKMKLAGTRVAVWLRDVVNVLDASDLTTDTNRQQIERHDVAECVLETIAPVACDISQEIAETGRVVIIDNYEIAGGGVVLDTLEASTTRIDEYVAQRQRSWDRSGITQSTRRQRYNQRSTLVLISGPVNSGKKIFAKELEEYLFSNGSFVYYLGLSDSLLGMDESEQSGDRDEYIRRLGEVSHLFTDAGLILITTVSDMDDYELDAIDTLNKPNDLLIVNVGTSQFNHRKVDLEVSEGIDPKAAVTQVKELLHKRNYLIEYYL
ncbi:MAG TPA: adenylyl-sulfate kinase [Phycisphaerales bacterium]|nr:adenylyl-sulfate kinase [Phycisphaerales bacterium]